jgi:hypothetical protein
MVTLINALIFVKEKIEKPLPLSLSEGCYDEGE